MPAHIVLPHIDHENVSEAEDEERRLPLERLGRLAALDRVGALNVEKQQVRLRRRALHPDPTRGLRAPIGGAHLVERGAVQRVEQRRLTARLRPDNRHDAIVAAPCLESHRLQVLFCGDTSPLAVVGDERRRAEAGWARAPDVDVGRGSKDQGVEQSRHLRNLRMRWGQAADTASLSKSHGIARRIGK